MREFVGGGLAAIAVTGAGWGLAQVLKSDDPAPRPAPIVRTAPVRCAEDDPCWNCSTMGNRVCGPVEGTLYVHPTGAIERR